MPEARRRAVILVHHAGEHAGNLRAPLGAAGYDVQTWLASDAPLPAAGSIDLLVVTGGIMGAHDEAQFPWIVDELRLIDRAIARDVPVLGLCLGGQMVSRVLGAWVGRAETPEIGIHEVTLTEAGRASPLSALSVSQGRTFQWHNDRFDLPKGAELLAHSQLTPCQAYRIGSGVVAVQFHPEAEGTQAQRWIANGSASLRGAGIDPERFAARLAEAAPDLEAMGGQFMRNWLASIAGEGPLTASAPSG